jgi:hypothetical protein
MSDEEGKAISEAEVKAHFGKKCPPPKQRIDSEVAKRMLKNLQKPQPVPAPLPSNYDRHIEKAHAEAVRSGSTKSDTIRRTGKTIPQLGEQPKQSCPPLQVSSDIANVPEGVVPGTNLGDYLPDHMLPKFDDVVPFRYEHGKPFVKPEEIPRLGTLMR